MWSSYTQVTKTHMAPKTWLLPAHPGSYPDTCWPCFSCFMCNTRMHTHTHTHTHSELCPSPETPPPSCPQAQGSHTGLDALPPVCPHTTHLPPHIHCVCVTDISVYLPVLHPQLQRLIPHTHRGQAQHPTLCPEVCVPTAGPLQGGVLIKVKDTTAIHSFHFAV